VDIEERKPAKENQNKLCLPEVARKLPSKTGCERKTNLLGIGIIV
jgi:hypothetical protein